MEKLDCILVQCVKLDNSDDHSSRTSRLLIDPNDRFLQIEKQLQNMSAKITNLENENRQLKLNDSSPEIEKQLHDMNAKIASLESENKLLKANGGTVFIRWGRKDCPNLNGTQIIYSGIAGGGAYHETGAGTTNLCLPHNPDYAENGFPQTVEKGFRARVWGAEFQYTHKNVQVDDDVRCAVCLDTTASTLMMIPAKSSCPKGWRAQYTGDLCADYFGHPGASEYICIDNDPQYFEGRRQNLDGRLFFPVATVCGSLPCPPYQNARFVACVVCTR